MSINILHFPATNKKGNIFVQLKYLIQIVNKRDLEKFSHLQCNSIGDTIE